MSGVDHWKTGMADDQTELRRYPNPWVAIPVLAAAVVGWWVGTRFAGVGCDGGGCAGAEIAGGIIGALIGAGGVLVVAVLAVRSLAEWAALTDHDRQQRQQRRRPPQC